MKPGIRRKPETGACTGSLGDYTPGAAAPWCAFREAFVRSICAFQAGPPRRRVAVPDARREVTMANQSTEPATNERIVRLLEEVTAQLADVREEQERIARDVAELLERR
jgi:hypothetical protein